MSVLLVLSDSLLAESHRLINVARMIAEAPSSVLGGQTARLHPSSREPAGVFCHQTSTLDSIGGRINLAIASGEDARLAAANESCRRELDALTHSSAQLAESQAQFRWRIEHSYTGVATAIVARREISTQAVIRKIREEAGQDSKGRTAAGEGERGA